VRDPHGGWAPHSSPRSGGSRAREAEGIRLAYVAATRARDLLVVPAIGDAPWDGGWLSPLNDALYPPADRRRTATRGPKCPAFKSKDTVLERPNDEMATPSTVCPGQHDLAGGYSVVWWDPGALTLGLKPAMGVRRDDLIVKDVARDVVADGRTKYDAWKLARINARDRGSVPTIRVKTVREFATDEATSTDEATEALRAQRIQDLQISVVSVPLWLRDVVRPSGPEFGTLVHAVLARMPFEATRGRSERHRRPGGGCWGCPMRTPRRPARSAEGVLGHELLARARRAAPAAPAGAKRPSR
jgi:hypothetical protein